jgi:DNA-binding beta-propeller fold protein YncE
MAVPAHDPHTSAISEVLRHLREGDRVGAAQVYRERLGGSLLEARKAVARLEEGQPAGSVPSTPGIAHVAGIVGAVMLLSMIGIGFILKGAQGPASTAATFPVGTSRHATAAGAATQPPKAAEWAQTVTRFGREGTGAGRFEDARAVAVDGTGRVYVAEYTGGRVQVFDSAGTFLTQWSADPEMPLLSMAANREGTVFIVQSSRIQRYRGATGERLGDFAAASGASFNDVTVALDGTLWALAGFADLLHLSRTGDVLASMDLKEVVDDKAKPERVAVAGDGSLYVANFGSGDVYRLTAEGRFVDRFGGDGGGGVGTHAPEDIVVDGYGRVYVSDSGIQVFDASGRHLASLAGSAAIFGLAVTDSDDLYASDRNTNQVVRFRLPDPTP